MEDFEEDHDFVSSDHDRLISAISKLDKTQHITEPTRSEPTQIGSEFNLIKRSNKLNLNNVVKVLKDTAHHVQVSKKLRKTQDASKVLPKPLEKPQAERIKRATGYEETKKKVGRWDPVVARNRTQDFVSFPLKHASSKLQPTEEFISKFKLKSQLEKELEEIDPPTIEEAEDEDEKIFPMTYDEMVEHKQHLAKLRAQQSYKAAKAKRQSKIKSKKYHRILKKERLKQQLKEFEDLQKKDPEEALKKLEALEKARALERHTLRHKNTGKWAKSKLVRAKYDKDVRQELAEQLAVSRGLTQKTQDTQSTDDETEINEMIPDINLAQDPMNPWMLQRSDRSNVDAEFDFGYKKYVQDKILKVEDDSDHSNNENDEKIQVEPVSDNFKALKASISKITEDESSSNMSFVEEKNDEPEKQKLPSLDLDRKPVKKQQIIMTRSFAKKIDKKLVATSIWVVEDIGNKMDNCKSSKSTEDILSAFDSFEDTLAGRVEKKLKRLRKDYEKFEKKTKAMEKRSTKEPKEEESDNLEYLKMKNQKVKSVIDEALIETTIADTTKSKDNNKPLFEILETAKAQNIQDITDKITSNIDPSRFIEVKPKYLNTALPRGEGAFDHLDDNDDDEQVVPKVNIEEVFEEDDIVASFRQEKEDEINRDKPEDIDLRLPGWGSWGGKGVKAPKRKNNRFILKAPPKMPRRDENKGDIIIKEFKDPKLALHKVKDIPFPFTSVKEYEASIRAPLGNTFIPEKAYKKLIKPSVFTKAGAIIDPMDEEELLLPKNRRFKNISVITLLGQK